MKNTVVTNSELELLKLLWETSPLTAPELAERAAASCGWDASTVKTLLARLVGKGAVRQCGRKRFYFYRPLLSREVLEEVLKKAAVTGAAAPAIPMVDTIKRAERGVVVETMDRSSLWAVQTPQVFEASLIRAALEKAVADGETLTDDCAAVERIGMKVSLTRGDRENIKLTTPFDLMVGEAIIRQREGY